MRLTLATQLLLLAIAVNAESFTVDGIRYHQAGNPAAPLVFLLHGTPGSSRAFTHLLAHPRLGAERHLIAVDRPRFGESANRPLTPDFSSQLPLLDAALERNSSRLKAVVVGHSLGGSIAYRFATDRPDEVGGLVIVSSSLSPKLGKPRWYNRLAVIPGVRYVVPGTLMQANDEIMPLSRELKKIEPALGSIEMPVTIIHGGKDKLVSPQNLEFARERLSAAVLKIVLEPDEGHFLLWDKPQVVVDAIVGIKPGRRASL